MSLGPLAPFSFLIPTSRAPHSAFTLPQQRARSAFTLMELMVVIAIILIMSVVVIPSLSSIKTAGDITASAYTIIEALEHGRAYAKANNTYVWVGFYEESANATTPTNTAPPYSGVGRVLIASVASKDGTKIFDNDDPIATLPAAQLNQIGKLTKVEGIHLTDIGSPTGGAPDTLDGRPGSPYTSGAGIGADHFNRISSDSADTTRFRFTVQNYTFYKTVRFNPRGEANINSTYQLKPVAEIAVVPAHGSSADLTSRNVLAIQFAGINGNFKVYRR